MRPGLRDYVRPLRRLGIEVTDAHLRDNEFNSIGFTDPGGQEVVLIEARTFPPGDWDSHNVAVCGEFFEVTRAGDRSRRVEPLLAARSGFAPSLPARRRTAGSGSRATG